MSNLRHAEKSVFDEIALLHDDFDVEQFLESLEKRDRLGGARLAAAPMAKPEARLRNNEGSKRLIRTRS